MTRAAKPHTTPVYESLRSAATRTGYSIPTFRDLIATRRLRAFRISDKPGSAIRVRVADVDSLMRPLIPDEIHPGQTDTPRRRETA